MLGNGQTTDPIHSGNSTLKPNTLFWGFCRPGSDCVFSEYERLSLKSRGRRTSFRLGSISSEFDWLWRLIECSWAFIPKRGLFIAVLMVLEPDNVPLSLRDTGYCHSDHKVTLANTVYSFVSGNNKDWKFMFTNLDWTQGDRNKITLVFLGWISLSVQTIAIPPITKYTRTVAIYICICIDWYIFAISTHLNLLDWRPQLYTVHPPTAHPGSYSPTVIVSLCSPLACCRVWSRLHGLEGSLEALQTAWAAVWGSAVLPCFCRLSTELSSLLSAHS